MYLRRERSIKLVWDPIGNQEIKKKKKKKCCCSQTNVQAHKQIHDNQVLGWMV